MKRILLFALMFTAVSICSAQKTAVTAKETVAATNDTVRIANAELGYEITIIEPGFNAWLATAKPRNYYSLTFLENKNYFFVSEWNRRVLDPRRSDLYEMQINYEHNIRYGHEVNYMLYNYFVYFQKRYNQKL